jgi:hypothetical protein
MSGVKWRRDRRIAKRKILRREYFWGSLSFYLQSKKAFGARLTEEIARLGFAPVLSAKLQRIWLCLL